MDHDALAEQLLDEADTAAAKSDIRYSGSEVLSRVRSRIKAADEFTDAELNARLQHSYEQSLAGEGRPMNEVFDDLEKDRK